MKITVKEIETEKLKEYNQEFVINILLGFITSVMFIPLICGTFDKNSLTQIIFRNITLISFLIQIVPLILSFTILKFTRSQGYWILFYWSSLFAELIIFAIGMFYFLD